MSIQLLICRYIHMSVCLYICQSMCIYISKSVCLSVHLSSYDLWVYPKTSNKVHPWIKIKIIHAHIIQGFRVYICQSRQSVPWISSLAYPGLAVVVSPSFSRGLLRIWLRGPPCHHWRPHTGLNLCCLPGWVNTCLLYTSPSPRD